MELANLLSTVEEALSAAIARAQFAPQLANACRHAVLGGGKRLRPVLLLESARAAGGQLQDALPAATAIELVHAFSLVHDDLPALDNDLLRRGLPTVHAKYGEALAILTGDALLSLAFGTLARSPHGCDHLLQELSTASMRMITGQCLDTLGGFPEGTTKAAQLELVHRQKTGALLTSSAVLGGMTANATTEVIHDLRTFGSNLGLIFQIVDDIIDETESSEHAGKATGKDREAGKLTYPVVHGLDASRLEVTRLERLAREALDSIAARDLGPSSGLEVLLQRCVSRTK